MHIAKVDVYVVSFAVEVIQIGVPVESSVTRI